MFWFKQKPTGKQQKVNAGDKTGGVCGNSSSQNRSSESQKIREQALANARAARLSIGEETLEKIAAAMTKKQQSVMEQAKGQIRNADPDKVLDELLYMLKNR